VNQRLVAIKATPNANGKSSKRGSVRVVSLRSEVVFTMGEGLPNL